ncbi:MAG TPA: histidine ammonia-lyase [Acidimicrobiia bacterium]|nr:histidine ammonia-lyase [Acidimicrobiia bacterium]
MQRQVVVSGDPLTVEDVVAVARRQASVVLGSGVAARMEPARRVVEKALDSDAVVYGVTTGFGALASTRVDREEAADLQVNLLRSHAAGVGDPLPDEVVRAMLLLRARTLSQGHSGVRAVVAERLLDLLAADLLPLVPCLGSVGASGDLAPFAHLALPLIGEGRLRFQGRVQEAGEGLRAEGLEPLRLEAKEGLSLLNGTEGMLAMACLGIDRAARLARAADAACAMSVEALLGSARPFRSDIHRLRPHPGQVDSARRIGSLLEGSELGASHADDFVHAVQDAYSLRCAPQVHGAVIDTIEHARRVASIELGAVVDNPIVFPETAEVVSGGNFHGAPLAFILDFVGIGVTELGSISERRIDRMLDPQHSSGLPPFLSPSAGLHSGYMLAQYTAAALVAESRVLSHPASIDSIPTSGSQEDHVSMGWGAGRKLLEILDNIALVIAAELVVAAQGIEFRQPLRPAPGVRAIWQGIRELVPVLTADRPIGSEIEEVADFVERGRLDEICGWKNL